MIKYLNRKTSGLALVAVLLAGQGFAVSGAAVLGPLYPKDNAVPISSVPHEGDYLPSMRIQPKYPRSAAEAGIGGYVVLELTVCEDGTVPANSIMVVKSEPEGVFNKVAKDAAKQFQYAPMMIDGKATAVTGVRYKFSFSTED